MDAVSSVNLAISMLDNLLLLLAHLKAQAGMSDEELLARAEATTEANRERIKTLIAGLITYDISYGPPHTL